jgi:hypothetical protein
MPWNFSASIDLGGPGQADGTLWALCGRSTNNASVLIPHPTLRDMSGAFAEGNGLYAFDTGGNLPDNIASTAYTRISIYRGSIGPSAANLINDELAQFTLGAMDEAAAKMGGLGGLIALGTNAGQITLSGGQTLVCNPAVVRNVTITP